MPFSTRSSRPPRQILDVPPTLIAASSTTELPAHSVADSSSRARTQSPYKKRGTKSMTVPATWRDAAPSAAALRVTTARHASETSARLARAFPGRARRMAADVCRANGEVRRRPRRTEPGRTRRRAPDAAAQNGPPVHPQRTSSGIPPHGAVGSLGPHARPHLLTREEAYGFLLPRGSRTPRLRGVECGVRLGVGGEPGRGIYPAGSAERSARVSATTRSWNAVSRT